MAALDVDAVGAAGDRAHAVFDVHRGEPRRLTARQAPRLLLWHAAYPEGEVAIDDPPLPRVTAPDGRAFGWDDGDLPAALEEDLGRAVTLRRDPTLMQDLEDSLLITVAATHRAVEEVLGPLDFLRWRPNLHLELDAGPFGEEAWEGAELRVGGACLTLLHPCVRCVIPTRDPQTAERRADILRWLARERDTLFGINARARGPARIAAGDAVELWPAQAAA